MSIVIQERPVPSAGVVVLVAVRRRRARVVLGHSTSSVHLVVIGSPGPKRPATGLVRDPPPGEPRKPAPPPKARRLEAPGTNWAARRRAPARRRGPCPRRRGTGC